MLVDITVPGKYAQIILNTVQDMGYKIEYGKADDVVRKVVQLDCNTYLKDQPLIDTELIQLALKPIQHDLVVQGLIRRADNDCVQSQHTYN